MIRPAPTNCDTPALSSEAPAVPMQTPVRALARALWVLVVFALLALSLSSTRLSANDARDNAKPAISQQDCVVAPSRTESSARLAPLPKWTGRGPVRHVSILVPLDDGEPATLLLPASPLRPAEHVRPPLRAPPFA
ncbi:hypothetical protein [Croceicoccus bisphenolivorans]|uniref:hypothetical protein n=1 Tax=Croceicoccus bisphenolivorans TaxID=1783232 RepID=UPI0008350CCC|nr:hypothetical protein [Croceicoccus bisphenolivorans]